MTEHLPSRATPGREYILQRLRMGYELHLEQTIAYLMPGHEDVIFLDAWRVVSSTSDLLVRWVPSRRGNVTVATSSGVTAQCTVPHYHITEIYRAA